MSVKASAETMPGDVLVDADVLMSYLISDQLSDHSERLMDEADKGHVRLQAASEIYDDIITALRAANTPKESVIEVLVDIRKIPLQILPTTSDVAVDAMMLYSQFGGPRRLHYFDSFHAATAKLYELPLVTSDRFILNNSRLLGMAAMDLRKV